MFAIRLVPVVIVSVLLPMLIYIVNLGWWMNENIVDSDNFVTATVVALKEESSRVAVNTIAVQRAVDERPSLEAIETVLIDALTAVLDDPLVDPILVTVGSRLYGLLLEGDGGGIVADLTVIEALVMDPLTAIAPELASEVPENFFSEVVLVEPGELPDVAGYVTAAQTIVWIAVALAALMVGILMMIVKRRRSATYFVGVSLALAGLASWFTAVGGRALIIGVAEDPNIEILMGNLYDQLAVSLKAQSRALIIVCFLLIALGLVLRLVRREPSPQIVS